MENLDIARTLETLADLLEIQGANPFRIRAYRNAINTIESLSRPLAAMVEAGEDLTELPAIGDNVAAHIAELLATGHINRLDEVPPPVTNQRPGAAGRCSSARSTAAAVNAVSVAAPSSVESPCTASKTGRKSFRSSDFGGLRVR